MQEFLSISLLIILAAISPGPDFAVVTKNSLMHSRKAGTYTALGVSVSILIHAVYCVLGLAIIISKFLFVFNVIKYLGASYLIYIGVKGLLSKSGSAQLNLEHSKSTITGSQAFYQGLFCNLLNPKAIMFSLAFFTVIVKPGHSLLIEIGYGFEIALLHMLWFSSLAYMMTHHSVKNKLSRIQFYVVKVMGAVLVVFGIRIATMSHVLMLPAAIIK